MRSTYVLNTYLFEHLVDYHVQQKDIARCLGISEAAVSKSIKFNHFSMLDIEEIAQLGCFTRGSFLRMEDGSPYHISQLQTCHLTAYRLYLLYSDLMSIFKTQKNIAKATGVSENKLKLLKITETDEKLGIVTPRKVLALFRYHEFLILISFIDNVDPWRYINDEDGWFPICDAMANKLVPAHSIMQYKNEKEAALHDSAMVAEDLSTKYNDACRKIKEDEAKCKSLSKALKVEQKNCKDKVSLISTIKSDTAKINGDVFRSNVFILEQLDKMEEHLPMGECSVFLKVIRSKIEYVNKLIGPKNEE